MYYINIRYNGAVETVDEFETYKEARLMLIEYRMGDSGYYISKRSTKEWREQK